VGSDEAHCTVRGICLLLINELKLQTMLATTLAISRTSPLNRSLMSSLSLLIFFLLLVRRHLGEFMNIENPYSVEIVALLF